MGQPFALRFLAGKLQGMDVSLEEMGDKFVLGRSREVDVMLDETMVSRKHARIYIERGALCIQDLGSTNGTFVNGQKIQSVGLKEGDRILVGTSLMKLIPADAMEGTAKLPMAGVEGTARVTLPPSMLDPTAAVTAMRSTGSTRFAGSIDEIPLLDLLQLLSTSKKSGTLEIQSPDGQGQIFLRSGQITYGTLGRSPGIKPEKALYRMLMWETGTFELKPPEGKTFEGQISDSTEGLILEAMRQLDEIRRIEPQLPAKESRLVLAHPLQSPLRNLSSERLDTLQLVHNLGLVSAILDKSPASDLETYEALVHLAKAGFITPAK